LNIHSIYGKFGKESINSKKFPTLESMQKCNKPERKKDLYFLGPGVVFAT
jgi:hypothetical protein